MSEDHQRQPTYITLNEAASYLGVSKSTLRNWDRDGRLKARRHPLNRYRVYDIESLRALRRQTTLLDEEIHSQAPVPKAATDARTVKRVVARLHSILRDTDGNSSLLQRFDELTKLLFLRLVSERAESSPTGLFLRERGETDAAFATRHRRAYKEYSSRLPNIIPSTFSTLQCSDQAIAQAGECLAQVSLADAEFDVKGVAYEEVIRGTFDRGDNQQFFTPHQVVSFMVSLQRPFLSGLVADPASGTAGFLTEIARVGARHERLLALEIDERLAWVAGINLLIHGAADFETRCLSEGGALGPQAEQFLGVIDSIITNPPFGSDYSDQSILQAFSLGRDRISRRRGILFIERCHALLKPGGTVAIIIDEGVLNLPSARDVRAFILEQFDVLAIISLPETAFMPYATVNASILLLKKSTAPSKSRRVFFGRADNIGRRPNGDDDIIYETDGTSRPNSDFPKILDAWSSALEGKAVPASEFAFVADVAENLKADDTLRLDFRYHHTSREQSRALLLAATHPVHSLADLCDERNNSLIPATEAPDQVILYTGLADIESRTGVAQQIPTPTASLKSAVKRYEPGDIVFARMRPALRKVALMSFQEGGFVSPECIVLTIRKSKDGVPLLDPHILAAVLRSDFVYGQIMHLIAGIGRPRLNTTDLRRVKVPVPPASVQQVGRRALQASLDAAQHLRQKSIALQQEASSLESGAVEHLAELLLVGEGRRQ